VSEEAHIAHSSSCEDETTLADSDNPPIVFKPYLLS
jgi:hypothetical protein